jgi:hypothetical protein
MAEPRSVAQMCEEARRAAEDDGAETFEVTAIEQKELHDTPLTREHAACLDESRTHICGLRIAVKGAARIRRR